jgi:hypothetical protein
MIDAFLRTPLRFWFRAAVVASLLWLVIATLWHWAALTREVAVAEMRHLYVCHAAGNGSGSACFTRAEHQLDVSRANALPTAIGVSALQLVLLWVVGTIGIGGARWALRALRCEEAEA